MWKGSVGKQSRTQILVPVLLVLVTRSCEGFTKCSIIPLGESVGLWVISCGSMLADVEVYAELLDEVVLEVGALVGEDLSRDTMA